MNKKYVSKTEAVDKYNALLKKYREELVKNAELEQKIRELRWMLLVYNSNKEAS